jgi:gliding motility-associated peptidyl-prolyl isomerase
MQPQPRKPVSSKTTSSMEASVSFNKKLIEQEDAIFKTLMANDSVNHYLNSANGFWYCFNEKSNHKIFPEVGDQILYTFEVRNVEGELIYDAQEIGVKTYYVDQQDIVEGLRNGLKLMNESDVVTFLFPSHKVFGYLGDKNKIGINQPLIYKVKLIKINKKNESN